MQKRIEERVQQNQTGEDKALLELYQMGKKYHEKIQKLANRKIQLAKKAYSFQEIFAGLTLNRKLSLQQDESIQNDLKKDAIRQQQLISEQIYRDLEKRTIQERKLQQKHYQMESSIPSESVVSMEPSEKGSMEK